MADRDVDRDDDLPLAGVVVADFSRILAGPFATMLLGDLGADVIKVESPDGDDTRRWGPPFAADGTATYNLAVNRNKRSIALDLGDPGDLAVARALALRADVVVENFKPGTMERFGLAYDDLRAERPRLVYCSISGFGRSGLGAAMPGYDPLVQAVGGLMSITGPEGGEPVKVGVAVVDVLAGLFAANGVQAALLRRAATGCGQRVDVTLLGSVLASLVNQASGYLNAGVVPQPLGSRHPSIEPFGTYQTADGPLMICGGNDRQFHALCAQLSIDPDPRFATNADRVANRDALGELLAERLRTATREEWVERLTPAGIPVGPVNDIAGAFSLADRLDLGAVHDAGATRQVSNPIGLSDSPPSTRLPPPALDEHGDEIRAWLGGGAR